ncbi:MAG: flavodoxin [Bacteroidales bacterium]|nr:flavodoxin [Bacteroidales bacterium]
MIGIFYGSATGSTADVAYKLAEALGIDSTNVFDVAKVAPSKLGDYDVLLLGTSTWGVGDMEDDWEDFINGAEELDLKDKKIAVFGCGDESMSDSFCSGVGKLYQRMQKTGATFIAPYNTDGYEYNQTDAKIDGQIVGLLIDNVNHPDLTQAKVDEWAKIVKEAI